MKENNDENEEYLENIRRLRREKKKRKKAEKHLIPDTEWKVVVGIMGTVLVIGYIN